MMVSLAVASITASGAYAQDGSFKDVPNDHWAYAAIEKLTAQNPKIFIGDPDGMMRGKRNLTRYEMAVIIARLLENIEASYAKKGTLVGGVNPPAPDLSEYAKKSDLAGLASKADVDAIRKLTGEFQVELNTLGVDMTAVKKRLDGLEGRVTKIEDTLAKLPKVNGQLSVYMRGNQRDRNGKRIIDRDGYLVGGQNRTLLNDTRVLHDLDLNLTAKPDEKTTLEATINFGNYLSYVGAVNQFAGNRSNATGTTPVGQDQVTTLYKALVRVEKVRVPGVTGASVEVGRIPMQLTQYTLKGIDTDTYLDNRKTDNGDLPLDGLRLVGMLGGVKMTAFGAKADPIRFVSNLSGTTFPGESSYALYAGSKVNPFAGGLTNRGQVLQSLITPSRSGAMAIEQLAGGMLEIPVGTMALTITGFSAAGPRLGNKVNVYGGGLTTKFKGLGVEGSYNRSESEGGPYKNNEAYEVGGAYRLGRIDLNAGYKYVGPYFGAPGNWDRLGTLQNPVDISGTFGKATLRLGDTTSLVGEVRSYQGLSTGGGLTPQDTINNSRLGLRFGRGKGSSLDLGAEITEYKLAGLGSAKPREVYYNIGYGTELTSNSLFKISYQVVDFKDKGGFASNYGGTQRGGVLTSTFNVKF